MSRPYPYCALMDIGVSLAAHQSVNSCSGHPRGELLMHRIYTNV